MNKNTITKRKWLIVPVEIKVRDFTSRLLLSLYASSKGFGVIFGYYNQVARHHLDLLPKGIFLDKSISTNKKEMFLNLIKKGFILTSIDEEGLSSYNNKYNYITKRISKDVLPLIKRLFTWGKIEREIILKSYPEVGDKVVSTGNPRIDLLKPEFSLIHKDTADKYKRKFGKYILFPSSFTVNHALGKDGAIKLINELGRIKNKKDEILYNIKFDFFRKTFTKFSELIKIVAEECPEYNIIVRPHPGEDRSFWQRLARNFKNIYIESEGSITPWIIASELVIHSSCTTGLEAFLLKKPVISFLPYKDHEYVKHISNDVSKECNSYNQVLDLIKSKNFNKIIVRENTTFLDNHLSNLNGQQAYKSIVKELSKINLEQQEFTLMRTSFWESILSILRMLKYRINPGRDLRKRYANQKYPGSTLSEINILINKFCTVIPSFSDYKFTVRELKKDVYLIISENKN